MEEKTNFFEKYWYLSVVLAVILVGVVASLWFYNQRAIQEKSDQAQMGVENFIPEETVSQIEEDAQTATLEQQSDSDEIADIEADLQNTNLSDLDKEMADIEYEIDNP